MRRHRWFRYLVAWAGWTSVGLFFSIQIFLIYRVLEGKPVSWWAAVSATLPDWYIWALLTFFILRLSRRFRLERIGWRLSLLVHLPASLFFSLLHLVLAVTVLHYVTGTTHSSSGWLEKFRFNFLIYYHWEVLTYWAIVGLSNALDYYRSFQERAVRASQLEAQLAQAQLQALKMQLQPHFLFNTLHSISSLVYEEPRKADRMIARLGDFLRMTLENAGTQSVPLGQELEFLKHYLEIEQVRFHDRLIVHFDIQPQTLEAQVPNLILQPIVENAIKHGFTPGTSSVRIDLRAERRQDWLLVQVQDNGSGLPVKAEAGKNMKEGLGLANTRARLQQLYGPAYRLELADASDGGAVVTLEIPYRAEAARVTEEGARKDERDIEPAGLNRG